MNQVKFKKYQKAAFLDRDGVINKDIGYLHKISDFEWVEGAKESIKFLKDSGFLVIVITNQSGVGRGFYSQEDLECLHKWINEQLKKQKTKIDDFFFSTDLPPKEIFESRRKPSPAMINEAVKKYNLDRSKCFLIGDKETDLESAKNAEIKGFLFKGGSLFDLTMLILKKNKFLKK